MPPRPGFPLAAALLLALCLPASTARADETKALLKKCKAGDGAACLRLGHAYGKTGKKKDRANARVLLSLACKFNQPQGCDDLGVMFAKGAGGARDPAAAQKMFTLACRLGHANGCYNLGAMFYQGKGKGIKKDLKRARKLFTKACAGEVASGCGNLALMYYRGEGGPQKKKEALLLFKKGCKGGSKMACRALKTPEIRALKKGKKGKKGKAARVSFKHVKIKGSCGLGLFAVFGLLGGIQGKLLPCLPGTATASVTVVNVRGKIKSVTVKPGGKVGACVKKAVRRLKWRGGTGKCTLSFDVGR